jgi:hypothetical protein
MDPFYVAEGVILSTQSRSTVSENPPAPFSSLERSNLHIVNNLTQAKGADCYKEILLRVNR